MIMKAVLDEARRNPLAKTSRFDEEVLAPTLAAPMQMDDQQRQWSG